MRKYHKIQSIFKRDEKTHKFIMSQYSRSEFEYLQYNKWIFTEKIDGTNIRIYWDKEKINIGGRTDNAQIPTFLYDKLIELFPKEKFEILYPDMEMMLFGEGYGAKIQSGSNYISNGVDFILFDVLINEIYLERDNVHDIANKLEVSHVPVVGEGALINLVELIKEGVKSTWGNFLAEGIVARPEQELLDRQGNRIITKIKHKDF